MDAHGLTHIQKDLIIFLLLVVILVIIVLAISWYVWRKCCGADLKRARQRRHAAESGVSVESGGNLGSQPSVFSSSSSGPRNQSQSPLPCYEEIDTNFWRMDNRPTVVPSAPALGSFREHSEANSRSLETLSTNTHRDSVTRDPVGSRLPSYESLMRGSRSTNQ